MNEVLKIIKENNGNITFKNILNKVNIPRDELLDIIKKMKLDGIILQVGNKYQIFPKDLKIGNVTITSNGRKYIYYNNEKISIVSNFLNDLILNDTVSFKLNKDNEAEVVTLIDRPLGRMTCEIKEIDGKKMVIPFHNGINFKFNNKILDTLYDGDIIVIEVIPENIYELPEAKFISKLGRKDDPLIDDVAIALNYGFDNVYDEEYLHELEKYPTYVTDEDILDRVDYRNQHSFTIDGVNTKDMDDGVYGEKLDNDIIRVYVHIADVSHYVKPNSKVFERACDKTTSLYMNNSVFHMLHHIISNGICSLNPHSDRLTKTVIMDIDKDGNIVNYEIVKSVINSKKKMTYPDVDEVIMKNNVLPEYAPFEKELYILYEAALRLEKRYVNELGKLNFHNNELSITYNEDGTIKKVANKENSLSMKIIENLMIAANETVANWFLTIDMPCVYRVHEFPNIDKVNNVIDSLNKSGYKIRQIRDVDNPKSMQNVLKILSGYEEFPIISQLLVMAMQRARYSVDNLGHYALGLPAYLHFTSPIRRLPDLLVHMMIDLIMINPEKITPEYLSEVTDKLKELAGHASKMERQADMAEAIAERREILHALARNKNAEYTASVIELGKKVKLRVEGVETEIDSHLLNKVFGYDSKRKRYYDRETGSHLKIGSKVLIKITSVDSINDNFTVQILGMPYKEEKKKVLTK